jgi:hypothetical protein
VQFSAADQKFLALLQGMGISIPTADAAEYAIEKGHSVCSHVASHPDAVVGSMILDDWIASTTIYGGSNLLRGILLPAGRWAQLLTI